MKKVFDFGKIDYNGIGKKVNSVLVEVELFEKECKNFETNEKELMWVFSSSFGIWNQRKTDVICGGKIFDELKSYIKNPLLNTIISLSERWQLNDLKSGSKNQCTAVELFRKENKIGSIWAYEQECNYLKSIGLYEDGAFKYGNGWWAEKIPNEVIEEIKDLIK